MKGPVPLWRTCAAPLTASNTELRVALAGVAVDELCLVRRSLADAAVVTRGVVNRVEDGIATLSLIGPPVQLGRDNVVIPTGAPLCVALGMHLLGCVLDGFGTIIERLHGDSTDTLQATLAPVRSAPLDYRQRRPVQVPFATGVRAIDSLLTVGQGQRMGVFAAAGCGKTTLTEMLLEGACCDVRIIALIGERGREVAAMVESLRGSSEAARTVVIQSSSDTSPATRVNAAQVATRVAEYFRSQGQRVLLVMDSVTRYARALRDVALAAGEPPARRGYPASVFEALPQLVERPGNTFEGSITAFYTVLLEEETDTDPVAEEIKSLLDGHVHLSLRLAQRGHYPAIDVLQSSSRLFPLLVGQTQAIAAQRVRMLLGRLQDLQLLRDIGEYRPGAQREQDDAVAREPMLNAFLQQPRHAQVPMATSLEELNALAR